MVDDGDLILGVAFRLGCELIESRSLAVVLANALYAFPSDCNHQSPSIPGLRMANSETKVSTAGVFVSP